MSEDLKTGHYVGTVKKLIEIHNSEYGTKLKLT